ncbi:gluconate 2-dehydrogenase subunit 3 family protein [Sulfurovum riftiae]|uniref:Gluconate 2-dehydrogenase subunit 3 family protein n=1 Tax=Sulfurovum riftiae TaxID=1630136 RepID=A0A151CDM5_9BACT|nr:gluconate 2-dehydrogenase subunit 3 family protein [Sulfurovum riftiae]KYJ85622.1 hypothetical protein AS592_00900 [Sulfurovum riftiae]
MERRNFLIAGSLLGLSSVLHAKAPDAFAKDFNEVEALIAAVQEHMFPQGTKLPSAREMRATAFLFETVAHPSYDRDIRAFVIEGARELNSREKGKFTTYTDKEKERALRAYEETGYGSNWLSRIMTLSMEALLSDPIYGGNVKEKGWKALKTEGGQPRPKSRYISL